MGVGLVGLLGDGRAVTAGAVVVPVGPDPLPAGVRVEPFVHPVTMPITLVWGPDGRLYYSDYAHMAIFVHHPDGSPAVRIAIPGVTASEGALLEMAFHPDFPGEPWIYIQYVQKEPLRNRIARWDRMEPYTPPGVTIVGLIWFKTLPGRRGRFCAWTR